MAAVRKCEVCGFEENPNRANFCSGCRMILFDERFVEFERLGAGGMGLVYRATDSELERTVAIKVVRTELLDGPGGEEARERFQREGRALAKLDHPNLVRVYELRMKPEPHMVMEYVEGETLAAVLVRHGAYPMEALRKVAVQVCSALEAAHRVGILHRDLKPENLMWDRRRGLVRVMDFGLAKLSEGSLAGRRHTRTGMGTEGYQAPEQLAKGGVVDARTDVWALGATFYELATGAQAVLVQREGRSELGRPASEAYRQLHGQELEAASEVDALLAKALAAKPGERWQSVVELGRAWQGLELRYELAVNGEPAGARVLVDEREVGKLPVRFDAGRGRHGVRVEAAGYKLHEADVELTRAVAAELVVTLEREASAHPAVPAGLRHVRVNEQGYHEYECEKDGSVLVLIPEGEFEMGSGPEDAEACDDEKPRHRVKLSAYLMGKVPVTNGQYRRFVAATGHRGPETYGQEFAGEEQPVVGVSWEDAVAYCEWAGLRLPTEAQWEKAARGTDGRKYPWGKEAPDETRANYGDKVGHATPVGQYAAGVSPYGLLDLAGNVWEWCVDRNGPYGPGPDRDPKGPDHGEYRLLRGGSWGSNAVRLRAAYRPDYTPTTRYYDVGFRAGR